MSRISDTVFNPWGVVCECGGDHRVRGNSKCPVFGIIRRLKYGIKHTLIMEEVNEFAKDGILSAFVRAIVRQEHDFRFIVFVREWRLSEQHPEWHLEEEISRLKDEFDQISSRMEVSLQNSYRDGRIVLPDFVSGEDPTLRRAKQKTIDCHNACYKIVVGYLSAGAIPISCSNPDAQGGLMEVDAVFRDAMNAIFQTSHIEIAMMLHLAKKSYEIWNETRRLLCDFKRPQK